MSLKFLSIFSGIESATVAWAPLGFEPIAFAEIDPFCCAVLAHRFPDVPNLGDVCEVDWKSWVEENGRPDVLVGGSPCFPAETLVLCEEGFKPIEQVEVGDRVVTHKGRLRKVLDVGSKVADTIMLKGQGSPGIECTANHPFYSRAVSREWNNAKRGWNRVESMPEWIAASDMGGRYWLNVCDTSCNKIPRFPEPGRGQSGKGYIEDFEFSEDFFYFVGRWLGDGWANEHKRKNRKDSRMKRVYVCCAHDKAQYLEGRLAKTGLHFGRYEAETTTKFTCSSTQLYDWIVGNFGIHAYGKNVPAWAMSMSEEFRAAMLLGYEESDGTPVKSGFAASTVSRPLMLGMKAIAGSLGYSVSVSYIENDRKCVIAGREVNERGYYRSQYSKHPHSAFFEDCGFYGRVRKVEPCRQGVRVYNLEVEDDNSYTADGIAVHNCQSFSVAGKRESLQGASRLMFEYIRAVAEVRPRWFVWENVPGALSAKGLEGEHGGAFRQLLREMDELGYCMAWRILDAQFWGVPQRRRRVFLVGHLGDDPSGPVEVLFEPEGVRGDHPSSREKREALAARAGRGAEAAGGGSGGGVGGDAATAQGVTAFKYSAGAKAQTMPTYSDGSCNTLTADWHAPAVLTPWDVQSKRINTPEGVSPTLQSGTGEGMNIQPVIAFKTDHLTQNGRIHDEEGMAFTVDTTNSNALAIDYKQTPKVTEGMCHTLTHEGDGGIHSAVAFTENQRNEVRLEGGDGSAVGALHAPSGKNEHFVCVTDTQSHTAVGVDIYGTLSAHSMKDPPVVAEVSE